MKKKQQERLVKLNSTLKNDLVVKKKIINVVLCLLLLILVVILGKVVNHQLDYEQNIRIQLLVAQEEEQELQEKMEAREEALLMSTRKYVEEVGVKSCVILCFDDFGKSAYGEVIKTMDKYGFKGVIIFRDGKIPGTKGAISVELYQELLDKGWEGAIGNSDSIRVYNNFPEVRRKDWEEYISGMQDAFREKGLEVPRIYIPHKNEILTGILDLLANYDLKTYTNLEEYFDDAKTQINLKTFLEMGMVVGKYDYKEQISNITQLIPNAESVAILFKRVENGSPKNKNNTSAYMLGKQLECLSMLSEFINVTTFSGYREYQQDIVAHNELLYKNYLIEQSSIRNQIALLKAQIAENYAEVFDSE